MKPALVALVAALCFGAAAAGHDDDDYYRYKRNYKRNNKSNKGGLTRITEALLRREEIIPDVIRDVDLDQDVKFEIVYPSGKVDAGKFFSTNATAAEPAVIICGAGNGLTTLIMADPDAPSRANPIRRNIWHWGVVNIPDGRVARGTLLAPYRGPGPPPDGGLHRYTFLLFKQNGQIDLPAVAPNATIDRALFNVDAFAGRNNLDLPVAANWFNSQNANPVPPALTPPRAAGSPPAAAGK